MGAIKPSKMPKPKKKARRDNTNFTQYKEGGKVNAAGNYTKPELRKKIVSQVKSAATHGTGAGQWSAARHNSSLRSTRQQVEVIVAKTAADELEQKRSEKAFADADARLDAITRSKLQSTHRLAQSSGDLQRSPLVDEAVAVVAV
jgi:hypothetical protein